MLLEEGFLSRGGEDPVGRIPEYDRRKGNRQQVAVRRATKAVALPRGRLDVPVRQSLGLGWIDLHRPSGIRPGR